MVQLLSQKTNHTQFGMCAVACGHATINQRQIRLTNRGNQGHFTFLLTCPKISRMTCFFWDGGSLQLSLISPKDELATETSKMLQLARSQWTPI
jgi:hypothetical protein